jgi:single-strand DNA-binding protein
MAKDLNSWCGTGRLCSDPELKYTPSGHAVANVRLAVNRGREEQGQDADFVTVELWRQAAEFAANFLKKGAKVSIQGRLRIRAWTAQDGSKRNSTEIVANEMNALDKRVVSEEPDAGPAPEVSDAAAADFDDPFANE